MKNILKTFNLSYSAWNVYKESQLQFYFQYIAKAEKTNQGVQVYGIAGNVVHNSIEDYVNTKKDTFDERWDRARVDSMRGMGGVKLSKYNYKLMYNKAIEHINNIDERSCVVAEQNFKFEFFGINIKGQIDLVLEAPSNYILIDWKTNSKNNYEMHKNQRLFYSWSILKTIGKIPISSWIYLKDNKTHLNHFSEDNLFNFEVELIKFIEDIKKKGFDIKNYEVGNWKNPFNQYQNLCADEVMKRIQGEKQNVTLKIKGHFVFLETVDPILEQGIDHATKFDLKDKFFMQKHARENNKGIIDIQDIGVYHLYNKRFRCFPIGLLKKVRQIIREYAEHYKKDIDVKVIDYRDKEIMNKRVGNFNKITMNQIHNELKIRNYQLDAVSKFLEKQQGIIQMATGAGKTFTAAEIIRCIDGNTLWIIDRKELLEQTKEALEKYLGVEVGVIMGKRCELDKSITIATIQSLNSKMKDIKNFLTIFNFVIIDEFHKSAAEGYQKVFAKLPNAKYKLGLTATPKRDDGKEPILFSILGEVIYKVSAQDLIKQGYLINPEINFIRIPENFDNYETYHEEYVETIGIDNMRNRKVMEICQNNPMKKILILTKLVEHGVLLKKLLDITGEVFHIHGSLSKRMRTKYYKNFVESKHNILIMTLSIGAEGLDIPDLDIIINAGANKGDVKSIQVLGRVLRTFKNKTKAIYYDFVDSGKWTYNHSLARMKAFKSEGYEVNVITNNK